VAFARLKRDHGSGWYDNPLKGGRGFMAATGEVRVAYSHALRDRSASSKQTFVSVAVIPYRYRNWHAAGSLARK